MQAPLKQDRQMSRPCSSSWDDDRSAAGTISYLRGKAEGTLFLVNFGEDCRGNEARQLVRVQTGHQVGLTRRNKIVKSAFLSCRSISRATICFTKFDKSFCICETPGGLLHSPPSGCLAVAGKDRGKV